MLKLKHVVALSKVKYMSSTHACKEAFWLKRLLGQLGVDAVKFYSFFCQTLF